MENSKKMNQTIAWSKYIKLEYEKINKNLTIKKSKDIK